MVLGVGEKKNYSWWRHQMETFSALLAICAGNSPVPANSPHKGQWRGALMFSLICVWINGWVNNREAGYLRRYRAHCDVTVMLKRKRIYWYRNCNPVTWNRRSDKQGGWCITHFKRQTADNRDIFVIIPRLLVKYIYRKISNTRRIKSKNINVSRLGLQLSSHNILKPSVQWRMKM